MIISVKKGDDILIRILISSKRGLNLGQGIEPRFPTRELLSEERERVTERERERTSNGAEGGD